MACQVKTMGNSGKQDVPSVLWIGVRDGDPGPIMLAREKPEAFEFHKRAKLDSEASDASRFRQRKR